MNLGASAQAVRAHIVPIVQQIQRADYEGDRPALKSLFDQLAPFMGDTELASRVHYWRGFALWRMAINGFNDSADPAELQEDLKLALDEFYASAASDPSFTDAKIGAISCLGYQAYMNRKDPARVKELIDAATPLMREAQAADPQNPRLLWVLGPKIWNTPPERGGGQQKAIESNQAGLEEARRRKGTSSDPLDPSWGEPELLMSLAWDSLSETVPDLPAAEKYARSALALVPYWHYVRDLLIPQIQAARSAKTPVGKL